MLIRQDAAQLGECPRADLRAPEDHGTLVESDGKRTDIVVLACTHYPFLANIFRRLAPWPVDWLDPAEAIARRALSLLNSSSPVDPGQQPDRAIVTSGNPDFPTRRLMHGFGLTLD